MQDIRRTLLGILLLLSLVVCPNANGADLAPGFVLERAGTITSLSHEVIAGRRSIKGAYSEGATYTPYLRTDPGRIFLAPGRTYEITFRYTIVEAPDHGFEVLFFSPTGGAAGSWLPSRTITGAAGSTGIASLRNTLGNYADYQARWNVVGKGAIVIDEIRIVEQRSSELIASEDGEGLAPQIRLVQAFLPEARAGRAFALSLSVTGGAPPYAWREGIFAPPPGLRLGTDGRLAGNPGSSGMYLFDAVVTDSTGATARLPLRLTVAASTVLPPREPLQVADGVATVRPQEYHQAFRNPLGGMRPHVNAAKNHPFASLARQYIEWNLIENDESDSVEKIRQVTDRLLGDLPALNIKAVPRVYLVWPDRGKYWPSDLTTDDYTSLAFRTRMKRLIARLGEAWNSDPRIAFVETGIVGWWGEQHHPGFASSFQQESLPIEMEREFGDAFRDAFPDKLVMNRYPRNLVDYQFGIHWDVFGAFDRGFWGNDTTGMLAELERPQHIDRWKVAPRGGEIAPDFLGEPNNSETSLRNVVLKHASRLIDIIRRLHWNHLDVLPALDHSNPELWDKASQIQNALGYRFVIDEASYSAFVQPASGLTLSLRATNVGSSPMYYAWPLEVALLDPIDRQPVWRSIWTDVDLRTWLPGEIVTHTQTFEIPPDLPAGEYVVAVAILDPAGMVPAARFANVNYWAGGRTPLGPLSVRVAKPLLQLNDFDDLQADRSLYYMP